MIDYLVRARCRYLSLFVLLFFLSVARGQSSYIYFQNNSSLSFSVNSIQTGPHTMDADEWWGMSGATINPWQLNTNVLRSNRESGIHNGTDFFLTTTLTSGGESVSLKIKLNGNFIGSDMWLSADGPGFSHPWYGDNDFHEQSFTLDGKNLTIKYVSYFTGGYDDLLFVIQEEDPFPVPASDLTDPTVLNVLSYNIFMLTPPISLSDQGTRAAHIHEHVSGYDAIIINEAFDNSARATLTANLSVEYPYYTDVVDESGSVEDGGVLIYSRWPIEYSEDIVYDDCDADDCLAAKGAMYARINKLGRKYHLFGTHTQAWPDAQNVATRQLQMAQLKAFVDAKAIPGMEPVILGGDFNVEKTADYLNEYTDMFTILNTEEPTYSGHPYTYDYEVSSYADAPYQEYLDYVMYEKSHLAATSHANNVIILRSIADDMWDIFDLSDHLAVQGRFVFPLTLPYELEVFEGEVTRRGNRLHWATASEINTACFEVQHSLDGTHFETVAKVDAVGHSASRSEYEAWHVQPPSGKNYYRLRGVDKDGSESFSDILLLQNEEVCFPTRIYPNPVLGTLYLDVPGGESLSLRIANAQGQWIRSVNLDGDTRSLYVGDLPEGMYYLSVGEEVLPFFRE